MARTVGLRTFCIDWHLRKLSSAHKTSGKAGTGGIHWTAEASLGIDVWVTAPPKATPANEAVPTIYKQYADATGHAPPLREDAMIFWYELGRLNPHGAFSVFKSYMARIGVDHVSSTIINRTRSII